VLEAIMLLLADESGAPFFIFLGLDARVLVKAIEQRYGRVLVEAGITGYEYLDKIVQIPFRIPPPAAKELEEYVSSLLCRSEEERQRIEAQGKEKRLEEKGAAIMAKLSIYIPAQSLYRRIFSLMIRINCEAFFV
jgi:predicted DNA-binding protein (UPF0278 family)